MRPIEEANALKAFRGIDLAPVIYHSSLWDEQLSDVAELNQEITSSIEMDVEDLADDPNRRPLGRVYLGEAGTGKTHLLARLKRFVTALGGQFILVDLSGVEDFLRTTVLHFLQSLLRDGKDKAFPGRRQLDLVLGEVYMQTMEGNSLATALNYVSGLARDWKPPEVDEFLRRFRPIGSGAPNRMQLVAVLRALLALCSDDDELMSLAHSWLQGVELESSQVKRLGLALPRMGLLQIIESEAYLMSLRGPTLVAFDQLDSIVHHKNQASKDEAERESADAALAIVSGIGGGLASLVNQLRRTLVVISCLESSWISLKDFAPNAQRFETPVHLSAITQQAVAAKLVEQRLRPAYAKAGFDPPYPTYPFKESFFSESGLRPRQLLSKCLDHIRKCRAGKQITELENFAALPAMPEIAQDQAGPDPLDAEFERAKQAADVASLLAIESEELLGGLCADLFQFVTRELPPPGTVDVTINRGSPKKGKLPSLHARMGLTYLEENDRESHICVRILQAAHPASFLARAKAAITESGIDLRLPFRHLTFIRTAPLPTGPRSQDLIKEIERRGGRFVGISNDELASIEAIKTMATRKDAAFDVWLQRRRPMSGLAISKALIGEYLALFSGGDKAHAASADADVRTKSTTDRSPLKVAEPAAPATADRAKASVRPPSAAPGFDNILIGRRDGFDSALVTLPISELSRHVVIRAGSGSGKTVLLKRLVESAALCGVPSIVVDGANDLVFLKDPAAVADPSWLPGDEERAKRYREEVSVCIWTPGLGAGRPLRFAALPDFSTLGALHDGDRDDLEQAVSMAVGSLTEIAGADNGSSARLKEAVLKETLRFFARKGGKSLAELADLMIDFPPEIQTGIRDAPKLAEQIGNMIRASIITDRLLANNSAGHDPGDLFHPAVDGRTRISVVSLEGLTEQERPRLVDQLAISLFSWIRKFPPGGPGRMNGLLVLDEAQEFLPSVRTTACKQSLMRLSVQARKYGLGLVVATQNPKNLDYNAVSQFSTHFYGKAAAPQAIEVIRKAIEDRGGHASDIANLAKGVFYFTSGGGWPTPVRVKCPMCLSSHPDQQTATEEQILARAAASNC